MKVLLTESQYQRLNEIDWEGEFSDVNKSCLNIDKFVQELNNELHKVLVNKELFGKEKNKERAKSTRTIHPFHSKTSINSLTKQSEEGLDIDIEKYIKAITAIPKSIFEVNSKMEKSTADGTQIVLNTGIPALFAIVFDKDSKQFYRINTCPKAGECINYCYARKGQYGMNDGLILKLLQRVNFLLNHPDMYYKRMARELEIKAFEAQYDSTDNKPVKLVIRWNDAGDFFSKKYFQMAIDVTNELVEKGYDVLSYAYTKDAEKYLAGNKDFIMNFSKDAKKSELKKLDLDTTKYSDVIKSKIDLKTPMWSDLFKKGEAGKKYSIDSVTGVPEFIPGGKELLKARLAKMYNIPIERLIFQNELPNKLGDRFQYDAIVYQKGDSDISAQRPDVQRTFLLFH